MLAKLQSAALQGLQAMPITIEINSDNSSENNKSRFVIVGLPDSAIKESTERVQAAVHSLGLDVSSRATVVNLAPADMRKEGSGFDLPIAIGLIKATDKVELPDLSGSRYMFVGELGLDGSIQPVKGALPIAILARRLNYEALFVPYDNAREAAVVDRLKVYGVEHLADVVDILQQRSLIQPTVVRTREEFYAQQLEIVNDFSDVRGQENVKRAFEVAAAGGHNIILIGSPGCGKSMMAKRLPSILPPLSLEESLETTQIHSIAGKLTRESTLISQRPFRAPHHTVSDVALIGGGNTFMPGEVCLAHNGVLFFDELPEFNRGVLETLRQPLEDRVVTVSRAKYTYTLPCSFQFVASMNPCPCGYHHHPTHPCVCTPAQRQKYMHRISGPLLDRIDIQVEVESVPFEDIARAPKGESSAAIRERVVRARQIQTERFVSQSRKDSEGRGFRVHCNAQMTSAQMHTYVEAKLDDGCLDRLRTAMCRLNLSARAYDRILKVSRTIADLDASDLIRPHHIAEAIGYRNLDREGWME